jgi:hypothetical protein
VVGQQLQFVWLPVPVPAALRLLFGELVFCDTSLQARQSQRRFQLLLWRLRQ